MNSPTPHPHPRKKPAHVEEKNPLWTYVAGGAVLVAATIGATLWLSGNSSSSGLMQVEVTLDNRCELIDEAFMAVAVPSGTKAGFEKGLAILKVPPQSKIYVKSHDRYPAFSFETGKYDAEPRMVITVNCGMGERIDRALDALQKQFKSRER